jgi:hypothetical protein
MKLRFWLSALMFALSFVGGLRAQTPKEIVQQAVNAEQAASRDDHSHWRFRQEEKVPVETVSIIVQTAQGSVREKVEQGGRPLTASQAQAEAKRVESFVHDPAQQQRQRRDSEHDDQSAQKLLAMLPKAFTWKVVGETPELVTLEFAPDPSFEPPDMEVRVMGAMAGRMVVDRAQHRIRTMRGTLSRDVNIGFGLLGKLRQGGTFDVERREVAPGLWQIVETHVHIDGRALLFKTIGEQQDEVNSGYTRVPDATTLEQAAAMLAERGGTTATR